MVIVSKATLPQSVIQKAPSTVKKGSYGQKLFTGSEFHRSKELGQA